jgi:hypothetical protein
MKPIEKVVIVGPIMLAWTIVWLFMPRFPEETITRFEWLFFITTQVVSLYFVVKWLSQDKQDKQSQHIKDSLRKHDRRTNR